MDISELKKMLRQSTAVLIMDNGEPSFVVVDYASYNKLLETAVGEKQIAPMAPPKPPQVGDLELLERINKDILALKAQIEEEEKALTS